MIDSFDSLRVFQPAGQEQFHCLNCECDGPLTVHGACEACGSQVVMSCERLALTAGEFIEQPFAVGYTIQIKFPKQALICEGLEYVPNHHHPDQAAGGAL